jgi:iron complex outermembrane receptor protein
MPAAPDWTINASYEHEFRLGSGASVFARADSHYESSSWLQFDHPAGLYQKSNIKSNASLTYVSPNKRFEYGAYIRNIENTAKIGGGATGGPGIGLAFLEPPRTYGGRVTVKF